MFPNFSGAPDRGSSPLARGLRDSELLGRRLRGIIPARAGFTVRRGIAGLRGRDHPRSCGVYSPRMRIGLGRLGSSPLVRGLLSVFNTGQDKGGIIPARAGFTPTPRPSSPPCTDHPRSCGVYAVGGGDGDLHAGSSPLVRGLLPRSAQSRQGRRIIPARAGFTPRRAPHARVTPWIIPARAGFTRSLPYSNQ